MIETQGAENALLICDANTHGGITGLLAVMGRYV
jgi:hypothetical protein